MNIVGFTRGENYGTARNPSSSKAVPGKAQGQQRSLQPLTTSTCTVIDDDDNHAHYDRYMREQKVAKELREHTTQKRIAAKEPGWNKTIHGRTSHDMPTNDVAMRNVKGHFIHSHRGDNSRRHHTCKGCTGSLLATRHPITDFQVQVQGSWTTCNAMVNAHHGMTNTSLDTTINRLFCEPQKVFQMRTPHRDSIPSCVKYVHKRLQEMPRTNGLTEISHNAG